VKIALILVWKCRSRCQRTVAVRSQSRFVVSALSR